MCPQYSTFTSVFSPEDWRMLKDVLGFGEQVGLEPDSGLRDCGREKSGN